LRCDLFPKSKMGNGNTVNIAITGLLRAVQESIGGEILSWQSLPNYRMTDSPRLTARCLIRRSEGIEAHILKANTQSKAVFNEVNALRTLVTYPLYPFSVPLLVDFHTSTDSWSWLLLKEAIAVTEMGINRAAKALAWLHAQRQLVDVWNVRQSSSELLTIQRERHWLSWLRELNEQSEDVLRRGVNTAIEILSTPPKTTVCFLHGDYHCHNLLSVSPRRSTGLLILDWEDTGIGHPWIDLAKYLSLCPGAEREGFLEYYRKASSRFGLEISPHIIVRAWAGALGEVVSYGTRTSEENLVELSDQIIEFAATYVGQ
jgi:hypothetical protein